MVSRTLFSSKTPHWETPQWLLEYLWRVFGQMDDPCPLNGSGGLTKSWKKKTYVNPPYGRPILQWTRKAFEESKKGKLVVMLLPARTDTSWWVYALKASEIWFIRGRIKFKGAKSSAPFPSVILFFKKKHKETPIKIKSIRFNDRQPQVKTVKAVTLNN